MRSIRRRRKGRSRKRRTRRLRRRRRNSSGGGGGGDDDNNNNNCGQTFRNILLNASCWPEWDEFDISPIIHVSSKK
jgi:hypothetical protein